MTADGVAAHGLHADDVAAWVPKKIDVVYRVDHHRAGAEPRASCRIEVTVRFAEPALPGRGDDRAQVARRDFGLGASDDRVVATVVAPTRTGTQARSEATTMRSASARPAAIGFSIRTGRQAPMQGSAWSGCR